MSSSSAPPPEASSRGSSLALVSGGSLLMIGLIGFASKLVGLPIDFHPAVAWAFAIAGLGFLIPVFVPFKCLQDYAGGVFLIVIATIGIAGTTTLNFQTSTGVGPGMMPRATGLIIVALGLIMIINGLFKEGEGLTPWSIRGLVFVLGSALVFAWTIRPLGLIIAGPLAVMISAFADKDTRWGEVMIFSVIMTIACIGLFSYGLKLPIPIWPTQTPYIPYVDTIKF